MGLQENFSCELQLTLRAGIVVRLRAVSRQRALPLEELLAAMTREEGLGPGPDTTVGFYFLMFFVDVITQTVREVELEWAELTFEWMTRTQMNGEFFLLLKVQLTFRTTE